MFRRLTSLKGRRVSLQTPRESLVLSRNSFSTTCEFHYRENKLRCKDLGLVAAMSSHVIAGFVPASPIYCIRNWSQNGGLGRRTNFRLSPLPSLCPGMRPSCVSSISLMRSDPFFRRSTMVGLLGAITGNFVLSEHHDAHPQNILSSRFFVLAGTRYDMLCVSSRFADIRPACAVCRFRRCSQRCE